MNRKTSACLLILTICGIATASCQGDAEGEAGTAGTAVHSKPEGSDDEARNLSGTSATAIAIDYEIMGLPVVGIPLSINVRVSSATEEPITVNYRIADPTSLVFSDAQAERVSLVPVGDNAFSAEQVTVIPQREGRLFLNVSADVESEYGRKSKVLAIPIQVGAQRPAPVSTGELTTGTAGEAPIPETGEED
jgi:hypothetical protein